MSDQLRLQLDRTFDIYAAIWRLDAIIRAPDGAIYDPDLDAAVEALHAAHARLETILLARLRQRESS
jgi:hypothetical protein